MLDMSHRESQIDMYHMPNLHAKNPGFRGFVCLKEVLTPERDLSTAKLSRLGILSYVDSQSAPWPRATETEGIGATQRDPPEIIFSNFNNFSLQRIS